MSDLLNHRCLWRACGTDLGLLLAAIRHEGDPCGGLCRTDAKDGVSPLVVANLFAA